MISLLELVELPTHFVFVYERGRITRTFLGLSLRVNPRDPSREQMAVQRTHFPVFHFGMAIAVCLKMDASFLSDPARLQTVHCLDVGRDFGGGSLGFW